MHIVFVTTELPPFLPGGAGSVVKRLRDRLVDRGDEVTVILVGDVEGETPPWLHAVGSALTFEERSALGADALRTVCDQERPDLIEFQDFDGLAFETLTHRADVGVTDVPIQVRFHGPADLMFSAIGSEPPEITVARTMEAESFRMADTVVVPSPAIARVVQEHYNLDPDRVIIGEPPIDPVPEIPLHPTPYPTIVSVARLGEVKGSHDLVQAAVPILRAHSDARLVLIGEDGWSATTNQPMSQWLEDDLIPDDVAGQIRLTGRLEGDALVSELAGAWMVVIASRFESFNLVAHEARGIGLPVILPDLAAFEGIFDSATGAEIYDGTVSGLSRTIEHLIVDESARSSLARASVPEHGEPLLAYGPPHTPRHPRAQSGLATMAVQRLERAQPPPPPEWSPDTEERSVHRRAASRILLSLPDGLAKSAVDRIPAGLRDRLAFVADWRYETERTRVETIEAQARAREEQARRSLDARIASGGFPELDEPLVSVVIPCHDDGVYLDEAIESVFHQSMDSFEIIVVDDGSTDPVTLRILDALPWPRTTVIHQDNQGLSAARNTGMAAAKGTYLVPLDADDAIEPDFLLRLLEALEANPRAGFASCRARLFQDINAIWIPRPYNPYQLLLSNSVVGCVLMRRTAYLDAGGYDESMHHGNEDWDLWIRMYEKDWDAVEVPEVLFRYRKHGISMSVSTEARFELGRAEIVERHRSLYDPQVMRDLKVRFYPLVSVVANAQRDLEVLTRQDIEDAQVVTLVDPTVDFMDTASARGWHITRADGLADAIDASTGKFVVRWSNVSDVDPSTLSLLAEHLERSPDTGAVTTTGDSPLVLVRRWSLLDPDAPSLVEHMDVTGNGSSALNPGEFPDPRWMAPTDTGGLPIQRQRPEEEGRLPAWVTD
jgi:GT2 family glycosyltransferase/glycosyltransferase involved in cell wall biosynthesis